MGSKKGNMNVLSVFDGISCGQVALNRSGIKVDNYFASEIDKKAIIVTQSNWPNTIQLGDVQTIYLNSLPKIDILLGGSPCQGFSLMGEQLGFDDTRSVLFFEFVKIYKYLKQKNPSLIWFFENVKMAKQYQVIIDGIFKIRPYRLNSSLVSAQSRNRQYWTNIHMLYPPKDKHIYLKDIIENGYVDRKKAPCLTANYGKGVGVNHYLKYQSKGIVFLNKREKQQSILDSIFEQEDTPDIMQEKGSYRMFTVKECCRLQTLPDDYCSMINKTAAYHALGNGWTVDIISHFFNFIK